MFDITYGLIVFYPEKDNILYHVCQRRDTLAYIQFIKGQVHESRLEICLSFMTINERQRIKSHDFSDLWTDLFSMPQLLINDKYLKAKEIFDKFDKKLLDKIKHSSTLEWTIPKGRKKHTNEFPLLCAKREYVEETTNRSFLYFVDTPPIQCIDDIKKEITYFFIAKSKYKYYHKHYILDNKIKRYSISPETKDLKWVTVDEAKNFLKPIHFNVLQKAHDIIKDNDFKFECVNSMIKKYSTL